MLEPCSRDVPEKDISKSVTDKKVHICLVVFEDPWRCSSHCALLKQRNGARGGEKKTPGPVGR